MEWQWTLLFLVLVVVLFLVLLFVVLWNPTVVVNRLEYSSYDAKYIDPILVPDIITKEECDYILNKAKDDFNKSKTLSGFETTIRKSEQAWLYPFKDNVIYTIYQRLAKQFHFPIENTEGLQVVKYTKGGFYKEHHDACCDPNDACMQFVKNGGQRILTILIYLNDDFEGGFTMFPNLNHRRLKPPPRGAVVFHPLEKGSDRCHPKALHTGTEVTKGVKYIATVWVHERKFKY